MLRIWRRDETILYLDNPEGVTTKQKKKGIYFLNLTFKFMRYMSVAILQQNKIKLKTSVQPSFIVMVKE